MNALPDSQTPADDRPVVVVGITGASGSMLVAVLLAIYLR